MEKIKRFAKFISENVNEGQIDFNKNPSLNGIKVGQNFDIEGEMGNYYGGTGQVPFGFSGVITKIESNRIIIKGEGNNVTNNNKKGCVIVKEENFKNITKKNTNGIIFWYLKDKFFSGSQIDSYFC